MTQPIKGPIDPAKQQQIAESQARRGSSPGPSPYGTPKAMMGVQSSQPREQEPPKGKDVVEMSKKLEQVEKVSTLRKIAPKVLWFLAGIVAGIAGALIIIDPFFILLALLAVLIGAGAEYIKHKNEERQMLLEAKGVSEKSNEILAQKDLKDETLKTELTTETNRFQKHLNSFVDEPQKFKGKKAVRKSFQQALRNFSTLQNAQLTEENLRQLNKKLKEINEILEKDIRPVFKVQIDLTPPTPTTTIDLTAE